MSVHGRHEGLIGTLINLLFRSFAMPNEAAQKAELHIKAILGSYHWVVPTHLIPCEVRPYQLCVRQVSLSRHN